MSTPIVNESSTTAASDLELVHYTLFAESTAPISNVDADPASFVAGGLKGLGYMLQCNLSIGLTVINPPDGSYILVKHQNNIAENGIYLVSQNSFRLDRVSYLGLLTTTVTTTDANADGDVDVTQTDAVITDASGNVVNATINVVGPTGTSAPDVQATLEADIDLVPSSTAAQALLDEIALLQSRVSCDKVQHLGAMEDYAELFRTAQEYISEVGPTGSINLVVDTTVLDNFATEAKVYGDMFEEISLQFNRLTTVNDIGALTQVRDALSKIADMYDTIEKFHATITGTSVLQLPESIQDANDSLAAVISSIECSLPYLHYFADGNASVLTQDQQTRAALNVEDQAAIDAAVAALGVWLAMVQNEANVTMNGNQYIQDFKAKIASFGALDTSLSSVVSQVQTKLAAWKLGNF
jgi:hypothetical protein